jgi:hypothetical protein
MLSITLKKKTEKPGKHNQTNAVGNQTDSALYEKEKKKRKEKNKYSIQKPTRADIPQEPPETTTPPE